MISSLEPTLDVPAKNRGLISLTPLIDVVFILLIFYLLATRFEDWTAIEVSAVGSGSTTSESNKVVRVLADGRIDWNGKIIQVSELTTLLQANNQQRTIQLLPEKGVTLQRTVDVLDSLKQIPNIQPLLKLPSIQ